MVSISPSNILSVGMMLWSLKMLSTGAYKFNLVSRSTSSFRMMMSTKVDAISIKAHEEYITSKAKTTVPANMKTLLELLQLKGEVIVDPVEYRKGMNPFLIPLSKNPSDGSLTCYIRWPTQKEASPLQVVRTVEAGLTLISMDTDKLCHRYAVEFDFESSSAAPKAIELVNKSGIAYTPGDFIPMIKSGKFPSLTKEDLGLILDRYLLTKVSSFPDCHERLANYFLKSGSEVSAFVTCERAITVYYGWGHPLSFNAQLMKQVKGREIEARDAARASLGMPAWTIASTNAELEKISMLAGYSGSKILGDMHLFRSKDERKDEIGEGLSPAQVALDQAAHLMDAIAFGTVTGGWDGIREELAQKYTAGGYPEMADFISS